MNGWSSDLIIIITGKQITSIPHSLLYYQSHVLGTARLDLALGPIYVNQSLTARILKREGTRFCIIFDVGVDETTRLWVPGFEEVTECPDEAHITSFGFIVIAFKSVCTQSLSATSTKYKWLF
jgi:hypothetical protein